MLLKETIIGNERAAQILEKGYNSGRISHAYLFTGPDHLGKKTLALNFCKLLLQDNHTALQNLQSGSIALRDYEVNDANIEKNVDLMIIRPDEEEKQITIEKIRDLEKKMSLYPYSARYKIVIIEQAEKMNKSAANALLKTLEEPSKTAVLILLASDSKNVLETIKSRCQLIKFLPVKKKALEKFLENKINSKEEIEKIIEISGYRPGKIVEFINDKNKIKEAEDDIKKICEILKKENNEKLDEAEIVSKNEINKIVSLLNLLTVHFRRSLIEECKNKNYSRDNLIKTKERIELIIKIKEDLLTKNINTRLAVENLFLSL